MATEEPSPAAPGNASALRISRGATAMGTDAPLGVVHQIIMNQRTGELQALVLILHGAAGGSRLELAATHVVRASGATVYLDVSAADLRLHPELTTPYNPQRYVPVRAHPFFSPNEAADGAHACVRPLVTHIERDAVGVIVPSTASQPAEQPAKQPEEQPAEQPAERPAGERGPFPPSHLTPTAPLIEPPTEKPRTDADDTDDSSADSTAPVVPVITASASASVGQQAAGLESAGVLPETLAAATANIANIANTNGEEREFMEAPFQPVNPGGATQTIRDDEGESRYAWVPAALLGALIICVAIWSALRIVLRGRRKAAKTVKRARANVRRSVRVAGKSAADLAQTVRASALEIAANPRESASDAFSNFSEVPVRYRWFRRGIRVGVQAQRLRRR